MATLDIEIGAELLKAVKSLALRHYGDDGSSSTSRVVHVAMAIRLLYLDLGEKGGQELDEPVAKWELGDALAGDQVQAILTDLLFKRR